MTGADTSAGELFDGTSARRRAVCAVARPDGLELSGPELAGEVIAWASLRFVDAPPGALVYGHAQRPGWRLRLEQPVPPGLADRLPAPARFGGWIDRLGLGRAVLALGLASALAVALVAAAPAWLGPLVPMAVERRIGDGLLGDLADHTCATPASEAALAALAATLDPQSPPARIQLIGAPLVNAAAVPGGRVLLFDGLVQQASGPDELAGVIGHELGHVRKRHVMQALLREFGLSVLLSGGQGQLGGTLGQLAAMRYSRSAEAEADQFARDRLARADLSPAPTAAFFAQLAKRGPVAPGTPLDWFASHPDSAGRAKAFAGAVVAGHAYRPALSAAQFAAIKGACKAHPPKGEALRW